MKMKTIIVEDEANILSETKRNLERMADIEVLGGFLSPLEALKFAHGHDIDLAILDIEMAGINGMDLAELLKKIYPAVFYRIQPVCHESIPASGNGVSDETVLLFGTGKCGPSLQGFD